MAKRVRATRHGYAPLEPGAPAERISPGVEFMVPDKSKSTWWEDMETAKPARKAKEDTPDNG